MNPRLRQFAAFLLLLGLALLQAPVLQARTSSSGRGCGACVAKCACCIHPGAPANSEAPAPAAPARESASQDHAVMPLLTGLVAAAPVFESSVFVRPSPLSPGSLPPIYRRHCSLLL